MLDGKELKLTPLELRLLVLLMKSPGRIFPRDYLLNHLYADHRVVTDRTIDSHIKNLRRKLQGARPDSEPIGSGVRRGLPAGNLIAMTWGPQRRSSCGANLGSNQLA